MFKLTLFDPDRKLVITWYYRSRSKALRNGKNWDLRRNGNTFNLEKVESYEERMKRILKENQLALFNLERFDQ